MLTVALDKLALTPGAAVLDVGCGRGRHTHAIAQRDGVLAVGIDLSFDDVKASRDAFFMIPESDGWGVANADALRLPFSDSVFDAVVCSEVLEHLPDYRAALAEIARVMKPGGALAVSVPRAWPEKICWRLSKGYRKTPGGHVRIFNAGELRGAIEHAGFAFVSRGSAHALHSPFWWLKCLLWDRRDTHPVVRAYQRVLEWDLMKRPLLTRVMESMLNPVLGKSIAMYFERRSAA